MNLYYQERKKYLADWKSQRNSTLRGCAMALEVGGEHNGVHIQGYIELKSGRTWQHYGKQFRVYPECFQTVRSGIGSYEYVTKSGSYSDKEGVLETWQTGPKEDFRLYDGSSESKADLKQCVGHIVDNILINLNFVGFLHQRIKLACNFVLTCCCHFVVVRFNY